MAAAPAFGRAVNVTDFSFSPAVVVDTSGAQTYSGRAGQFTGSLGPLAPVGSFGPQAAPTSFTAYCIELTQSFSFNVTYQYSEVDAVTYIGAQKAADLSRLFTATAGLVTNASASGAIQSAIWEIAYEVGSSYDFLGGAFKVGAANQLNDPTFATFNSILMNLDSYNPSAQIYMLRNSQNQDFIVAVPEPGTWAMLVAGLGVLGLVSRRRQR